MTEHHEKLPPVIPLPYPKKESVDAAVPKRIPLNPQSQIAIQEIRQRVGHTNATPEDVVAMAVEVFNVLTDHLSVENSKVILYTQGVGLKTLEIPSSSTFATQGIRTIEKRVQPPKTGAGGR